MMTTNTAAELAPGMVLCVEKGCKGTSFTIKKGDRFQVLAIRELGAEYSHQVEVEMAPLQGSHALKRMGFTAHHRNRLSDLKVRLSRWGTFIEVSRVASKG